MLNLELEQSINIAKKGVSKVRALDCSGDDGQEKMYGTCHLGLVIIVKNVYI